MRIISGNYKGRIITAPKNLPVRPTTDMCKEALFNILNNRYNLNELQILDLFAGTGNISYEFASRGAKSIIAVDGNTHCVNFIKKTTAAFDFNISVIKSDVFVFLSKCKTNFDIIFADPPYELAQIDFEKIINQTIENKLLIESGILIIEHSKHTKLTEHPNFFEERKYGGSIFSFFKALE